jgi:hypothetical protein
MESKKHAFCPEGCWPSSWPPDPDAGAVTVAPEEQVLLLAYYSADVVAVNLKVAGLAPGAGHHDINGVDCTGNLFQIMSTSVSLSAA